MGEFFKQRRHGCLGAMTDGLGCGHLLLCRGGLACSTMSVLYWFPASLQQHATFRHLCASLLVCTVCACLRARGASGMVHFFSVQAARRDAGTRAKCGVASWVGNGSDGGGRRRASSSCRCFRARLRNGRRVCPLRVFLKAKGQGFVHVAL